MPPYVGVRVSPHSPGGHHVSISPLLRALRSAFFRATRTFVPCVLAFDAFSSRARRLAPGACFRLSKNLRLRPRFFPPARRADLPAIALAEAGAQRRRVRRPSQLPGPSHTPRPNSSPLTPGNSPAINISQTLRYNYGISRNGMAAKFFPGERTRPRVLWLAPSPATSQHSPVTIIFFETLWPNPL